MQISPFFYYLDLFDPNVTLLLTYSFSLFAMVYKIEMGNYSSLQKKRTTYVSFLKTLTCGNVSDK